MRGQVLIVDGVTVYVVPAGDDPLLQAVEGLVIVSDRGSESATEAAIRRGLDSLR